MFVFLRFTLDTTPDAAWDALTSPAVFRQVSAPLVRVRSREKGGFPERWIDGTPHEVSLRLLGIFPLGHQRIQVSFAERPGGVRMIIDKGAGLTGFLRVMPRWDHRMAVSATDDGRTLYRDRLAVRAGLLTPLVWLSMWAFWQVRASRLKRLASTWAEPHTSQVPHTD
ncbi:MAG: hypothetical protein F2808_03080 [Actinobacteria bacterium]|uniref:Unannotated protein n=1 Tax=freshwater metagenome TaxID=449393 RepID=A0A6J7FLH9_9ZZZZ|nr:hypothetical protein [Actinomycetota bacterium]